MQPFEPNASAISANSASIASSLLTLLNSVSEMHPLPSASNSSKSGRSLSVESSTSRRFASRPTVLSKQLFHPAPGEGVMSSPYWHQHAPSPSSSILAISADGHSSLTSSMQASSLATSPTYNSPATFRLFSTHLHPETAAHVFGHASAAVWPTTTPSTEEPSHL